MRHSYYGYFYVRWKGRESMKEGKNFGHLSHEQHYKHHVHAHFVIVQSGSTVQFLSDECNGDAYLIRKESHRRWKFEVVYFNK